MEQITIGDVQGLHDLSKDLYQKVVLGKADFIINDLKRSIDTLKQSWEGKDAGVQINNVIEVYNAMIKIRNALAELSKDSSLVALKYRGIQNANRANLEELAPVTIDGEKMRMENYDDQRDTINITNEALAGKEVLDNANTQFEEFINEVDRYYDLIMNNWKSGDGRQKAIAAFDDFKGESSKYKTTLSEVSQSITDSLKNYNMIQ